MVRPVRIILVEDHALTRAGTGDFLRKQTDFAVVGEAEDGQGALAAIDSLKPDVAILDIRLPEISGIEVARRMRELSPDTKGLVLTAFDDDDYILAAMQVGVSGYLLKTARPEELADAVRKVSKGETVLDPNISAKVAKLWLRRGSPANDDAVARLTDREREVLDCVARGLRNKEIAAWLSLSAHTVAAHLSSIYEKLNVSSRTQAALYARSQGIDGKDVKV